MNFIKICFYKVYNAFVLFFLIILIFIIFILDKKASYQKFKRNI